MLLRHNSSDVSLPFGARTSSPGSPKYSHLQVSNLIPQNCSTLPFLPPSCPTPLFVLCPTHLASPPPPPCLFLAPSPVRILPGPQGLAPAPPPPGVLLTSPFCISSFSLVVTLGSPVPPGRQGAPHPLGPPPLSASTSSGWDPGGMAGCAVSALAPEQSPQHLL